MLQGCGRKYGPGGINHSKEATFHFELYRSISDMMSDSYIHPEFGLGTGYSVDILIPGQNWGIEILFDSRSVKSHTARFAPGGAYSKLGLKDFIMLNFRQSKPRVPKLGNYKLKSPQLCMLLTVFRQRV